MDGKASPPGFDVLLTDGSTAHVRAIAPHDEPAVRALYSRLSHETIVLRYFGPHPQLSSKEIEALIHPDGVDVVVLIAEVHDLIVAVAQYYREPGRDDAEVAFLVDDSYQGHGIGTILLEHLAGEARRHGIRQFAADTLTENYKMLRVLAEAGFVRQYQRDAEVMRVVLDIESTPDARAAADARDQTAVIRSIRRLLEPRTVAVIGAGRQKGTIGHELLRNLLAGGFEGPVYPVNPSATYVASVPCWPNVGTIPGEVDLAVIAVPERAVAQAIAECGAKSVSSLVVITAGFAERGSEGVDSQHALAALAHSHGMRMVGPNCFGVINTNPAVSMNATFAPEAPLFGRAGFASQSGGLGIAILGEARARDLGLSSFISMGNKADVSGNDLLQWWEQDDATQVILLYLESFGNPRKFSRIARRVGRSKPIVALKSGRTKAGTRAASSHTAALASSDQAVDALFHQTGVVRVATIEELFDVGELLAHQPVPQGRRVTIVGNAGGPGVLAADACISHGLEVPEFSTELQSVLADLLPPGASVRNPIDLAASATSEGYKKALEALLSSDEIDSIIVIFTPPLVTRADDVAHAVVEAVDASTVEGRAKSVVASFLGAGAVRPILHRASRPVPCFAYPENAARALAHAATYGDWRARPLGVVADLENAKPNEARRLIAASCPSGSGWLTGADAQEILAAYGISVVPTTLVHDTEAAAAEADRLGCPVALKAWGPAIVHKSDVGGVRLGVKGPDAVVAAFSEMAVSLAGAMEGAVIQPMVDSGVETIVGFVQNAEFGPQVIFGLGGTAVELVGDVVTRLAPLTDLDARDMVLGLRATPLLLGYRGSQPVAINALVDVILRLGRLAEDLPEIAEVDCNPVIATPTGALVVDARMRISSDAVARADDVRHLR
ncbi:MAG TPA: GNAT family N-acetyltransferase [Acidimicrobiales bacterium]|nr:GNAT family N-acetyltransferase [Acidimicrobiales bacterium]